MKHMILAAILSITFPGFHCTENTRTANNYDMSKEGIRIVKKGLDHPWEITWGKDNNIWMTEREGKISRIDPETGKTTFSQSISEVESRGEGGLLGLALHPDFLSNGFLYVVYNYRKSGDYLEKVVRFKFSENTLSGPTTILDGIAAAGIHNGSRLWITDGPDPKIFISTGDASERGQSQKTNSLNGKILRLNLDGSIPADNPFPNNPVWSFGHRNAQGMVMANQMLYASEHGPDEEDELNIIEKGRNYGWPEVMGPCNNNDKSFCNSHNVKEPIWSSGNSTIAVCGLDYYNKGIIPEWKNSLLMVTLKNSSLRQLKLSENGQSVVETKTWFSDAWGRLRDVCISPAGKVYVCSSNGGDDVLVEISGL
jgi:aldose sugar dehydrogenase